MSIGWAIIINGIIGAILYVPAVLLFRWFCYKKFGENTSENGFQDYQKFSDDVGEDVSSGSQKRFALFGAFNWLMTIFLWELEVPFKFYLIYTAIKNRKELLCEGLWRLFLYRLQSWRYMRKA